MSSENPQQESQTQTIHNQPTLVELEDFEELSDDGLLDHNSEWDLQPLRPPPPSSRTVKLTYGLLILFVIFCVGGIILLAYSTLFPELPQKFVDAKFIQVWPMTVCAVNNCKMKVTRYKRVKADQLVIIVQVL